jgi:hypothetical protein
MEQVEKQVRRPASGRIGYDRAGSDTIGQRVIGESAAGVKPGRKENTMGWSGTGDGDVFVTRADLDRFCQERLDGGGPPNQRLRNWLRAYDLDPT